MASGRSTSESASADAYLPSSTNADVGVATDVESAAAPLVFGSVHEPESTPDTEPGTWADIEQAWIEGIFSAANTSIGQTLISDENLVRVDDLFGPNLKL